MISLYQTEFEKLLKQALPTEYTGSENNKQDALSCWEVRFNAAEQKPPVLPPSSRAAAS